MIERQQETQLLIQAGQLLLEYNESTRGIIDTLTSTARVLRDEPCHVSVTYLSVAVTFADEPPVLRSVKELRLNAAVRTRIHEVLQQIRAKEINVAAGLELLNRAVSETPRLPRWLATVLFGGAACSFARLLGADGGAIAMAGVSTMIGLRVRQELGSRHVGLLLLPLSAAFIGSALGGIAIRLGWTQSSELVLLVPALMLVPGAHLLNALFDLVDNHISMSLSRLGLALGILVASGLGIVVGARFALPLGELPTEPPGGPDLTLLSDMILAGIATCGFAASFNVPWRQMGLVAIGGMAGHGTRFLALENGFPLDTASFFGGLIVAQLQRASPQRSAPVAVLAFAGAVTMVPGSSFYRALGGALRLARHGDSNLDALAATTLGHACQGIVVVGALALGLLMGIRLVLWIAECRQGPGALNR